MTLPMKHGSYSRCSSYLRCGYAYHLQYELGWKAEDRSEPLTVGSWVHVGLEAAVRDLSLGSIGIHVASKVAIEHAFSSVPSVIFEGVDEDDGTLAELSDKAAGIAHHVIADELACGKWETVMIEGEPVVEYRMEIDTGCGVPFVLVIDWLARNTETGEVWLFDWKTRATLTDEVSEHYNAQMALYQYALSTVGVQVCGTCTYQIRTRERSVPKMLKEKKGKPPAMSRGAIATDWATYERALLDNGLNPAEYADMQDKLKPFHRAHYTHRSAEECEGVWREYMRLHEAMALSSKYIHLPIFRNLSGYNCSTCEYRDACMEGLTNSDVNPLEHGLTTPESRGEQS